MLTISSISYTYKGRKGSEVRAVDCVSICARPGGITAIVGPNGGGKSTLFRIVTRSLRADAGSVSFEGNELGAADMGVVFQSPSLDMSLSARENLEHHALLFGTKLKNLRNLPEIFDTLGIEDVLESKIDQLSGGYRRRVELAKALITDPRVLVLDEPFSGLDTKVRAQFFALLQQLAVTRGLTVLLITHELDLASRCAHVVVLRDGRVFADSPPSELLQIFGDTIVEVRSDQSADVAMRLEAAGLHVLRLRSDAIILPRVGLRAVLDALGDEASLSVIEARKPTLDDWFIVRTGGHLLEEEGAMAA